MVRTVSVGRDAIQRKGWWRAHQWLVMRRISQLSILALFLIGPLYGVWIVKGTLASSLTLDTVPLTDPFILLQLLFTGHIPEMTAVIGALIIIGFYLVVGGRTYCSWVCPVNAITDAAAWAQEKLGVKTPVRFPRNARFWILGLTLVLALVTGTLAWELVNPVSTVYRALVFGLGMGWMVLVAIFVFDLAVSRRGWCGHLCPMGAFYSLLNHVTPLRVSAWQRERCDDCMDCFVVCPEPQVIKPALKGEGLGLGPVILDAQCTSCGRCIDICGKEVFRYAARFHNRTVDPISMHKEVTP